MGRKRPLPDCRNSWQKLIGCQRVGRRRRLACSTGIKETYHYTQVSNCCIWECGRMSYVLTAGLVRKVVVDRVEYSIMRTEYGKISWRWQGAKPLPYLNDGLMSQEMDLYSTDSPSRATPSTRITERNRRLICCSRECSRTYEDPAIASQRARLPDARCREPFEATSAFCRRPAPW